MIRIEDLVLRHVFVTALTQEGIFSQVHYVMCFENIMLRCIISWQQKTSSYPDRESLAVIWTHPVSLYCNGPQLGCADAALSFRNRFGRGKVVSHCGKLERG